jgi:hypothetical protein
VIVLEVSPGKSCPGKGRFIEYGDLFGAILVKGDGQHFREIKKKVIQYPGFVVLGDVRVVSDPGDSFNPFMVALDQGIRFLGGVDSVGRDEIVDIGSFILVEEVGHGECDHSDHDGNANEKGNQDLEPEWYEKLFPHLDNRPLSHFVG